MNHQFTSGGQEILVPQELELECLQPDIAPATKNVRQGVTNQRNGPSNDCDQQLCVHASDPTVLRGDGQTDLQRELRIPNIHLGPLSDIERIAEISRDTSPTGVRPRMGAPTALGLQIQALPRCHAELLLSTYASP